MSTVNPAGSYQPQDLSSRDAEGSNPPPATTTAHAVAQPIFGGGFGQTVFGGNSQAFNVGFSFGASFLAVDPVGIHRLPETQSLSVKLEERPLEQTTPDVPQALPFNELEGKRAQEQRPDISHHHQSARAAEAPEQRAPVDNATSLGEHSKQDNNGIPASLINDDYNDGVHREPVSIRLVDYAALERTKKRERLIKGSAFVVAAVGTLVLIVGASAKLSNPLACKIAGAVLIVGGLGSFGAYSFYLHVKEKKKGQESLAAK